MLTFAWEPLIHLLQTGLYDLGERSWEENGYEKGLVGYNPDWKRYKRLEDEGILRFFAARAEGTLVGYASVIITGSFHDSAICCAIAQDIYLAPEHRKGMAGRKFLWVLEEQVKALGAHSLTVSERIGGRPTGKLFERLGYQHDERIWTKPLAEGRA